MNQMSFSDEAYTSKKRTTRKERFLSEMNAVLPWQYLLKPILRKYPKPGNGRRPIPAETMLRIYFLQQWYGLSDPAMEDSLYDVESMRRFAGVGLDGIPDETTMCKFRHFLEQHGLTEVLFQRSQQYLSDRGLMVNQPRDDSGRHDHSGAIFDQESGPSPRSRDGLYEEGEYLAFRHESAYRQRPSGTRAQRRGDLGLGT